MKPHSDQNVSSKVLINSNQIQRYSSSSAEYPNFVLATACKTTSSPALLHFCIKG